MTQPQKVPAKNYYYYWSLAQYLSRADGHYVEGRSLWLQSMWSGASILLWLAVEQMIKTIITQARITNETLPSRAGDNPVAYDPHEMDISKVHNLIDKEFSRIGKAHKLDRLLRQYKEHLGNELTLHIDAMEKLEQFFNRRYVIHEGNSLHSDNLKQIDEVYFTLRGMVDPRVSRAFIDEIAWQKKLDGKHPAQYFVYAYKDNEHFASREHPTINQSLGDGRMLLNDGVKDEITDDFDWLALARKAAKTKSNNGL